MLERNSLRYTPAGVPVSEFRVAHESVQSEAGSERRVECEVACVALGTPALVLKEASSGVAVELNGFLAARSLKQKTPVFHVTTVRFAE